MNRRAFCGVFLGAIAAPFIRPPAPDYRNDVVAFVRDFMGVEPDPWQVDYLELLQRNRDAVMRGIVRPDGMLVQLSADRGRAWRTVAYNRL